MALPRLALVGSPRSASPWLLQAIPRIGTLEAICDEEAERDVARYAARWAFSSVEALLKEAEPDGIIVEQPLAARAGVIKQCLARGVGVLVTGSPASAAVCKRLGTVAKLAGRVLMAAPAIRFAPAIAVARRLLDSGKFGSPISLIVNSSRRGIARAGAEDDGPVSVDQVFEAVALVHHLVGPIRQVSASAHADGVLAANGATDSGIIISLVCHAIGPADVAGVRVEMLAGDANLLQIDQNCRLTCGNGSRADAVHGVSLTSADPVVELGFEGLLAEFRRHLEAGRGSPGWAGPVPEAVAACEAILASVSKGRSVMPRYEGESAGSGRRGGREAKPETSDA